MRECVCVCVCQCLLLPDCSLGHHFSEKETKRFFFQVNPFFSQTDFRTRDRMFVFVSSPDFKRLIFRSTATGSEKKLHIDWSQSLMRSIFVAGNNRWKGELNDFDWSGFNGLFTTNGWRDIWSKRHPWSGEGLELRLLGLKWPSGPRRLLNGHTFWEAGFESRLAKKCF